MSYAPSPLHAVTSCAALVAALLMSCGDAPPTDSTPGCRLNSDCPPDQVCEAARCVKADTCVGPDCPCLSDADCPGDLLCDTDSGACYTARCFDDNDCPLGDVCLAGRCETDLEADRDRDGVPDNVDNCAEIENSDQEDNDGDGQGDACDSDDDNDAIPDTIDNCPLVHNPTQGDADGNGLGNACDPDTPGITVRGSLNFAALPGATTADARVFIGGDDAAQDIDAQGAFAFGDGLQEPGRFAIRVLWPGFLPVVEEFSAPDRQAELTLDPIVMVPLSQDDADTVAINGRATLEGLEQHADIVVRARVNGTLVETTLTDDDGAFVATLPPVDVTLQFNKAGYDPLQINLLYNTQGPQAGRFTRDDVPIEALDDLVLERATGTASVSVEVSPAWIPQSQRAVTVTVIGEGLERSAVSSGAAVAFTDLPAGTYLALADKPGFSQALTSFTIDQNQPSTNLTLSVSLETLGQADLDLSGASLTGADLRQIGDLRGANLAGSRLVGADPDSGAQLCDLDLSQVSLVGADLAGANLAGATLDGARLDNATLEGAVLRAADLSNVSAFGANLNGVDLRNGGYDCVGAPRPGGKTRLTSANLSSASLTGARFTSSDGPDQGEACALAQRDSPELTLVRWNQTDLSDAVMHSIDLRNAEMTATDMTGADLRSACLSGATLLRTDMTDADAQSADLREVRALDALWLRTDLTGAVMTDASLSGVNMTDAVLDAVEGSSMAIADGLLGGVSMRDATLTRSRWVGALLNDVDLTNARFTDADLRNTQMVDVTLTGSNMVNADLRNAIVSALDLRDINFQGASLDSANLSRSRLEGADFTDASLLGANFILASYDDQTAWPQGFGFTTISALGPGTQMSGFIFPNDFTLTDASLAGANFTGARLSGTNFDGADLSGAILIGADLTETNLSGADLTGALLQGVKSVGLTGSCPQALPQDWQCRDHPATGGILLVGPGIDFRGANLREVDLSGTTLTGAYGVFDASEGLPNLLPEGWAYSLLADGVSGVLLGPGVDLSGADLRLINLGFDTDLSGANLSGADLSNLSLGGARFYGTNLSGANLSETSLQGAQFTQDTDLSDANLQSARTDFIQGTCPLNLPPQWACRDNFQQNFTVVLLGPTANLESAGLVEVDLRNIDLSFANLTGANLDRSDLRGANLHGANLSNVSLENAVTHGLTACPGNEGGSLSSQNNAEPYYCAAQTALNLNAIVGARLNLSNAALSGFNFQGINLTGVDLSDADLRGASLIDVNLEDATLTDAALFGADMTQARPIRMRGTCPLSLPTDYWCLSPDLNDPVIGVYLIGPGVDLSGEQLAFVNMNGTNLTGANLNDTRLEDADLNDVNLTDATMVQTDLTRANLTGVNLTDADLESARMPQTTLIDATFNNTNLTSADLFQADLRGVNLSDCQLQGANFDSAEFSGVTAQNILDCALLLPRDWTCRPQPAAGRFVLVGPQANLNGVDLSNADLNFTVLTDATMLLTNLNSASLGGADLSGADLSGADLNFAFAQEASLINAVLTDADLNSVNLSDANLERADLTGADLSDARLERADLTGTDLSDANLNGASLLDAILNGTIFSDATVCPDGQPQSANPNCAGP